MQELATTGLNLLPQWGILGAFIFIVVFLSGLFVWSVDRMLRLTLSAQAQNQHELKEVASRSIEVNEKVIVAIAHLESKIDGLVRR